jgi:hypothetical protein
LQGTGTATREKRFAGFLCTLVDEALVGKDLPTSNDVSLDYRDDTGACPGELGGLLAAECELVARALVSI